MKTTILGILTILSAVSAAALEFMQSGTIPNLELLIPAIVGGIGLIKAADQNK